MDKQQIIDYIMHTPSNTNPVILGQFLDEYGGNEYTLLFEEEVTTAIGGDAPFPVGILSYNEYINADTIKVTFDGVEYQCDLIAMNEANYYGGIDNTSGEPDFSEYPFTIQSVSDVGTIIATQTPGTHTIKVEASQSNSPSSDWSTAEVTFINDSSEQRIYTVNCANILETEISVDEITVLPEESLVLTIPLYKKQYFLQRAMISDAYPNGETTGEITKSGLDFIIAGDGTITLTGLKEYSSEEHTV